MGLTAIGHGPRIRIIIMRKKQYFLGSILSSEIMLPQHLAAPHQQHSRLRNPGMKVEQSNNAGNPQQGPVFSPQLTARPSGHQPKTRDVSEGHEFEDLRICTGRGDSDNDQYMNKEGGGAELHSVEESQIVSNRRSGIHLPMTDDGRCGSAGVASQETPGCNVGGGTCRTASAHIERCRCDDACLSTIIIPSPEQKVDPCKVTVSASSSVIIWALKTSWNETGGLVPGVDEFWDGSGLLVRRHRVPSSSCIIHCPTRIA